MPVPAAACTKIARLLPRHWVCATPVPRSTPGRICCDQAVCSARYRPALAGGPLMDWLRACGFVLATLMAVQAQAHVFFDRAEPRVGSTVSVAPAQVKLWFSEAIEPAASTAMGM